MGNNFGMRAFTSSASAAPQSAASEAGSSLEKPTGPSPTLPTSPQSARVVMQQPGLPQQPSTQVLTRRPPSPGTRTVSQFPTSTTAKAVTDLEKEFSRAPFVCEFLGTAMFAFTVTCCNLCGDAHWNPAVIGFAYMTLTYAVGPASGGNLNPAVSMTLAILGKIRYPVAAGYIFVQTMGALMGVNIAKFLLFRHATPHLMVGAIAPFQWMQAASVEVSFTAMLCFVAANCTVSENNNPSKDRNQFYGLAVGFSIIAGMYSVTDISGVGCFNPALAASLNNPDLQHGIVYGFLVGGFEMCGAVVAAALYCLCRRSPEDDDVGRVIVQQRSMGARLMSEFLGTFYIAATVGLNLIMETGAMPIAAAAALMSMVYSVGRVSGGHFNPAVTLAIVLGGRDKCDASEGLVYGLIQFAAGLTAGLAVAAVHGFQDTGLAVQSVLSVKPGFNWTESFVAEIVFTMLLAYVVLTVTTAPALPSLSKQNFYFGLAIGSCYIVGGFAIGPISGGVLNPAVAAGVAMESSLMVSWSELWTPKGPVVAQNSHRILDQQALQIGPFGQVANLIQFTAAELIGGALAAAVFGFTHPQEFVSKDRYNSYYRDDDPTLSLL